MLDIPRIREILKSPDKKGTIQKAIDHERRVRFHSETALSDRDAGRAATDFLEWVRTILPADKFGIFCTLFRYPIKTVNLTGKAYSVLEKVFDGRDANNNYEFLTEELETDWESYQEEKLDEPWIWRSTAFEHMKSRINSVLVVDLPSKQTSMLPEPYFYWLPIEEVISFEERKDELEWIIFCQPGDRIAVFDDTHYRVFATKPKTKEIITPALIETPHGLGYCPARFFWTTSVNLTDTAVKKSPISDYLADLDWYLFFTTSKRHLDLYGPYPIYSGFEQDCDYEEKLNERTLHCDRGFLRDESNVYVFGSHGSLTPCPLCSTRRIAGVGSFVEIPMPSPENGNADMRNPVQVLTIDKGSLDYNVEEVKRLESEFYQGVTGYGGEPVNDQAVNEKQIIAAFESRKGVLLNLKKEFEYAQYWVDSTICRLRYKSSFEKASVNYGTEYYLESADELLLSYEKSKAAGSDDIVLDEKQEQYFDTRHKNNPERMARVLLLMNVDPFRHLNKAQVQELYKLQAITKEEYLVKFNFSSLIMRFERENGNIVNFGGAISLDKKVERIREALINYVTLIEANGSETTDDEPDPEGVKIPGAGG